MIVELSVGIDVFVREKGFYHFQTETLALFKVIGITDLAVWRACRKGFAEIAPSTVKKALTGSGRAGKGEVAAALERFVGKQAYVTDDESDAVALGIAWLIQSYDLKPKKGGNGFEWISTAHGYLDTGHESCYHRFRQSEDRHRRTVVCRLRFLRFVIVP